VKRPPLVALLGFGLLLSSVPAQQASAQQISAQQASDASLRERMLAVARDYASFEWQGAAGNVQHGPDADGIGVDTPDVSFDPKGWKPDATNHGMPYAWGGFTSIEEFRAGLQAGRPAGQVPTTERARASAAAMGLDCSGFIARCWELPIKQSTRSLGALCYPLPEAAALQPGDILNCFDSHVVLFEGWTDDSHAKLKVFEAARLQIQESVYTASKLLAAGFQPMRYKPLDARWMPMTLEARAFSAGEGEGRWTPAGEAQPLDLGTPPLSLRGARPGQWTRYRLGAPEDGATLATLVAAAEGERVDTQSELSLPDGRLSTGRRCEHAGAPLETLLDFAAPDEPLAAVALREGTLTPGRYELGGRSFAAQRLQAVLTATHTVRHQDLPVTITVDAVLGADVPLHGVLEASFTWETVWSAEPGQEPLIGRHVERSRLMEFGGARSEQPAR
jgi:hypothetical protein